MPLVAAPSLYLPKALLYKVFFSACKLRVDKHHLTSCHLVNSLLCSLENLSTFYPTDDAEVGFLSVPLPTLARLADAILTNVDFGLECLCNAAKMLQRCRVQLPVAVLFYLSAPDLNLPLV